IAMVWMRCLRSLLGIIVVGERQYVTFEIDEPGFSRRLFTAELVTDMDDAEHGTPHGPTPSQPGRGVDRRHPDGFRRCVVLVQDRAPPIDHRLFDFDRARSR